MLSALAQYLENNFKKCGITMRKLLEYPQRCSFCEPHHKTNILATLVVIASSSSASAKEKSSSQADQSISVSNAWKMKQGCWVVIGEWSDSNFRCRYVLIWKLLQHSLLSVGLPF